MAYSWLSVSPAEPYHDEGRNPSSPTVDRDPGGAGLARAPG